MSAIENLAAMGMLDEIIAVAKAKNKEEQLARERAAMHHDKGVRDAAE